MIGVRLRASALLLWFGSATLCAEPYTVRSGESLTRIAVNEYGDGGYWPAIMLATNSRLSQEPALSFIGDPNALTPGQIVWVPPAEEMRRWMDRYRAYLAAVLDMSLPQPWEVSERLIALPADRPATVVTWAREGQFTPGRSRAGRQIWVTVAPLVQEFCRGLGEPERLVERLEQRLGLPPASNKTVFIEIEVSQPASAMFRPCADPSIETRTCPLGPPVSPIGAEHREWFLSQYFASYASAQPTRFPWTSLGYTYDWGHPVSEQGESEFVIRPEATIEVLSITPTEEYCSP